jgi:alpha-L-fucosidase
MEKRIIEFERMAFGMIIHWGLYSKRGVGDWSMGLKKTPADEYRKHIESFTAGGFDAVAIVKLAKRAGMKYIVLTARHHEGFSLYDTRGLSDFDAVHSPAGRDLVEEFVKACRQEGIVPFLYHTTLDWQKESYKSDFPAYLEYLRKSIEVLCTNYGKIGGFWFDGNWDKPNADWQLDAMYETVRKYQPEAIIINNTGLKDQGRVVHPEIDCVTFEQVLPKTVLRSDTKKYVASEMGQTMNEYWGMVNHDFSYKSTRELIETLCYCRGRNSNYLLNVGLELEGRVPKIQEAILETLGEFMQLYGYIFYEGKPADISGTDRDFALQTSSGDLYLFIHSLGIDGSANVVVPGLEMGLRSFSGVHRKVSQIQWLDNRELLHFAHNQENGILCFNATGFPYGEQHVVRVAKLS